MSQGGFKQYDVNLFVCLSVCLSVPSDVEVGADQTQPNVSQLFLPRPVKNSPPVKLKLAAGAYTLRENRLNLRLGGSRDMQPLEK